jgi:hypothetical protein
VSQFEFKIQTEMLPTRATALNFSGNSLKLLRSMSSDRGFVSDRRGLERAKARHGVLRQAELKPGSSG